MYRKFFVTVLEAGHDVFVGRVLRAEGQVKLPGRAKRPDDGQARNKESAEGWRFVCAKARMML